MLLETIFAFGPIVGIIFLFHVTILATVLVSLAWDLIHVIWFRVICRHFDINHRGKLYRTINAIDDQSEWLLRPVELYVDLAEWSWDRLTGKSRKKLVKRVAHLEAQLESLVDFRGQIGILLKREGALICRAEKAEQRLVETEELLDGYPEVRCDNLVSLS